MDLYTSHFGLLMEGLKLTIAFSVVAVALEVFFGLIAALMRLAKNFISRGIGTVYVEVFRSTPLLVQLFFVVFGIPSVVPEVNDWFGQKYYPMVAAAVTLALNEGAYVTEIIRAGILGVDRGQKEAAASIGMTGFQSMRHIVLPQAFKRMIPPLVNQAAQTIKDTTLLAPVGVVEMLYKGEIVVASTFAGFQIYGFVAVIYFIVIFTLSKISAYVERRMQLDKR